MFERLAVGDQFTFIVAYDHGLEPVAVGESFARCDGPHVHLFRLDEIHTSKDGRTVALLTTYQGRVAVM